MEGGGGWAPRPSPSSSRKRLFKKDDRETGLGTAIDPHGRMAVGNLEIYIFLKQFFTAFSEREKDYFLLLSTKNWFPLQLLWQGSDKGREESELADLYRA